MEIIVSNKGQRKVIYEGYMYLKKKANSNGDIRWECIQRRNVSRCLGSILTNQVVDSVLSQKPHCHGPDFGAISAAKCKLAIKERAKLSKDNPSVIFAEQIGTLSEEAKIHFPPEESIKRSIRQNRRLLYPKEPSCLLDLQISGEWELLGVQNPEKFLIFDSFGDENRCFILARKKCLEILSSSRVWYMDGTFAHVPKNFRQVYVIHGEVGNTVAPLVYVLMQSKSRTAYEILFQALVSYCQDLEIELNPVKAVLDFEQAAIKALTRTFGAIEIQCCFFHLCQSTWRKVQELGLTTLYKEDESIRCQVGMMDGLAFLPLCKVKEGMAFLREHFNQSLTELLEYFDCTYVNGPYKSIRNPNATLGVALQRRRPMFPPHMWNMHNSTIDGARRTNNCAEGWNNRFSKLISGSRPCVWTVIEALRKDAIASGNTIVLYEAGREIPKRRMKKTIAYQKMLLKLCQRFDEGRADLPHFLRQVGKTIRL